MASIDYPYAFPHNEGERAANRQAQEEYERAEHEAADFLDGEDELNT